MTLQKCTKYCYIFHRNTTQVQTHLHLDLLIVTGGREINNASLVFGRYKALRDIKIICQLREDFSLTYTQCQLLQYLYFAVPKSNKKRIINSET